MIRAVTAVSWYRFRATFRRRWGAYLTLVLLVGVLGGVAMGALGAQVGLFSQALTREAAKCCATYSTAALRVSGGAGGLAAVKTEVDELIGKAATAAAASGGSPRLAIATAERAIRPESIALGVFGAVAALAALLIGAQVIGRQVRIVGDTYGLLSVQRPAEIVNYQSTGDTPDVLAAALAASAIVALGLTLAASVRRRRRELALLKTLGFTQRQLAGAVAWQATVAAVIGVVVGIPAGIAVGRWLWIIFARAIYAVPEPSVPVGTIVGVALGALLLANLAAAIPGRIAARTRTALILRSE